MLNTLSSLEKEHSYVKKEDLNYWWQRSYQIQWGYDCISIFQQNILKLRESISFLQFKRRPDSDSHSVLSIKQEVASQQKSNFNLKKNPVTATSNVQN